MNCKTCIWWSQYGHLGKGLLWGKCENPAAHLLTTSNDQGELSTHEDFGCVKWEKQ